LEYIQGETKARVRRKRAKRARKEREKPSTWKRKDRKSRSSYNDPRGREGKRAGVQKKIGERNVNRSCSDSSVEKGLPAHW